MRRFLRVAIKNLKKIQMNNNVGSKGSHESLKSLIIQNISKFKNDELVKIIETFNERTNKDDQILKSSYEVIKNNVHTYSFEQINKILKLYSSSQIKDTNFNLSISNYIKKRLDALPLSTTVNIFNNLIRSGLRDSTSIHTMKNYFIKNIDAFNSLDLTIILHSFTLLQEEKILKKESSENCKEENCHENYNDLFTVILNRIQTDENVLSNLSAINAVLILNMMSRANIRNHDIFMLFTKRYFKHLKEKDLEFHHYTLLLNSFAKCNVHINVLKYLVKYMNDINFIQNLSYVNIMNAVHYMAKSNYRHKQFLENLKTRIVQIIEQIPQREFSNILWALSKLKVVDSSFHLVSLEKIEKMVSLLDPMSIAQLLDALRRVCQQSTLQFLDNKSDTIQNDINKKNNIIRKEEKKNEEELTVVKEIPEKIQQVHTIHRNSKEKKVVQLLIQKYLSFIENCSLHVLTQVPFCCLQLNCTDYEVYYKSLEMIKIKKKQMNTINLMYAKYFIRLLIEKQEHLFRKLPRPMKQFTKDILNSDN